MLSHLGLQLLVAPERTQELQVPFRSPRHFLLGRPAVWLTGWQGRILPLARPHNSQAPALKLWFSLWFPTLKPQISGVPTPKNMHPSFMKGIPGLKAKAIDLCGAKAYSDSTNVGVDQSCLGGFPSCESQIVLLVVSNVGQTNKRGYGGSTDIGESIPLPPFPNFPYQT